MKGELKIMRQFEEKNRLKVLPKQPLFVLATQKYYKSIVTKNGISHFYSFRAEKGAKTDAVAIPDGTIDILFCCDKDYPEANICGTVMHPKVVLHKDCPYFGIRFLPGVIPKNCDVSMADLVENQIPLKEVLKDKTLFERIIEAKNFEQRQKLFMDSYLNDYYEEEKTKSNQEIYNYMIREIVSNAGEITVAQMAKNMMYSERYINKIFKEFTGISPKKYCKLMQFQYLLDHLDLSKEELNFAVLSSDIGFYDQSHMIKDFKHYTDYTPQKYFDYMHKEKFNNRLIITR